MNRRAYRSLATLLFMSVVLFGGSLLAQEPVEVETVPWAIMDRPLDIAECGDGRLYVARQMGIISMVTDSMTVLPQPFLNLFAVTIFSGERGLLGLAFDPDHAQNGHFYITYVRNEGLYGTLRLSRFTRSASDPEVADPLSEVVLIELPQPDPIHQAGGLVFGPDGYLYCAIGDGGGASDPNDFGQDATNLFGTIIRIKPEADGTYSIPPDNPFVNDTTGRRAEIWAYGLRNPFRIAIDPLNGDLWIGDVGQQSYEEINRWPGGDNSGPNFGWRCVEGNMPFIPDGCDPLTDMVPPVLAQANLLLGGTFCAIMAGEVYRGNLWPRLQGRFFYTDYCLGGIRTLTPDGQGGYVDQEAMPAAFLGGSSFHQAADGRIYMTSTSGNRVYQVKDRCPMPKPEVLPDGNVLVCSAEGSYAWFLDGDPISGANAQELEVLGPGAYTVQVTYANGCVKLSEPYFHLSTDLPSVSNRSWVAHDATAGRLLIGMPRDANGEGAVHVLDAAGKTLLESRLRFERGLAEQALPELRMGAYIAAIEVEGVVHRVRFAVMR